MNFLLAMFYVLAVVGVIVGAVLLGFGFSICLEWWYDFVCRKTGGGFLSFIIGIPLPIIVVAIIMLGLILK
jgi:hypothetical protein